MKGCDVDLQPLVTLKQMVKRAKIRRVEAALSSDESDAVDSDENAHISSETDSDDSRVGFCYVLT